MDTVESKKFDYNKPTVNYFEYDNSNKTYRIVNEPKENYDPVNKPSHYANTKYQPIDVIEDWGLDFCLGNTLKYIKRAGHKKSGTLDDKAKEIQDLEKAEFYLNRRIQQLERQVQSNGTK